MPYPDLAFHPSTASRQTDSLTPGGRSTLEGSGLEESNLTVHSENAAIWIVKTVLEDA